MEKILADIGSQISGATGGNTVESIVGNVLDAIFVIMGIIAVIFIIIGGINYILSQGDPGKIKKAKDTILYAIVGLVVSMLAFAIVNFALGALE